MAAPDHVFESTDGVIRLAVYGPVFAGVYESPLTATAFKQVLTWQRKVMPKEDKIIPCSIAFGAHRLPPDVKEAADRLLAEFGPQTAASVNILIAEGFQASAARAMLGTIYLLTRVSYPRKVVATVAEGDAWLRSVLGESKHLASIDHAFKWLREREAAGPRNAHE
jgi:hypothetical protein